MIVVSRAGPEELGDALAVWHRARSAAGGQPPAARTERVREKLAAPHALAVVARRRESVVAMALLEPARADDGRGVELPGQGHVSMVFVDPEWQGRGVGRELMEGAHSLGAKEGWVSTSLWTRESNAPAQGLYRSVGYRPTERTGIAPDGGTMRLWWRSVPST